MDRENQENVVKINIAKALCRLAVVKNQERSDTQIAAYSEYLSKHFSYEQIVEACEYFLQRKPFFPDISEFFNLLRPLRTLEQVAIQLPYEVRQAIEESGFNYGKFHLRARADMIEYVKRVGWSEVHKIYAKDAVEIARSILNNPKFYLENIKAEKNEEGSAKKSAGNIGHSEGFAERGIVLDIGHGPNRENNV